MGVHGAGAALYAKQHCGAKPGIGYGFMEKVGASCFAIPTKYTPNQSLPLDVIQHYVHHFLGCTYQTDYEYEVTPIGCGLAGYSPAQIAPMFLQCWEYPEEYKNIHLPEVFISVLNGLSPK